MNCPKIKKTIRIIFALLTCFGIVIIYAFIGVILGWKHGGGAIPMLIMLSCLGFTWRAIIGKKTDNGENEMNCSHSGDLMNNETSHYTSCSMKYENSIQESERVSKHLIIEKNESKKIQKIKTSTLISLILLGIVLFFIGVILSSCLHLAFHTIAIVGSLIVLIAINKLIARSQYPPTKK